MACGERAFFARSAWRRRAAAIFTAGEDVPTGRRCASSATSCGRPVRRVATIDRRRDDQLNGQPWQVIGVMPPQRDGAVRQVQVFAPRVFEVGGLTPAQDRGRRRLFAADRAAEVRACRSMQARRELAALGRAYRAEFAANLDAEQRQRRRSTTSTSIVGRLKPTFYTLLGAVGVVLLIACANVASLFLGRLAARQREIAVRLSLGATRGRDRAAVSRREPGLSAIAAALVGTLLALWALSAVQSVFGQQLPPNTDFALDWRALAFLRRIALISSALLVGLVPALQASQSGLVETLKDARAARRARAAAGCAPCLIVVEVALSVVLLVGSGLLLASFRRPAADTARLRSVRRRRGLRRPAHQSVPHGGAAGRVLRPCRRATLDASRRWRRRRRARPARQRSQRAVALQRRGPADPAAAATAAGLAPNRERGLLPRASDSAARGPRDSRSRIATGRRGVCVINEALAARLFPGGSALGQQLARGRDADLVHTIVGVVADVRSNGVTAPVPDEIYYPVRQLGRANFTVIARTSGDAALLQNMIRAAVADVDAGSRFRSSRPWTARSPRVSVSSASSPASRCALPPLRVILAAVGLYSVVSYAVAQRRHEIGIRMALGARPAQVLSLVMRGGLALVGIGLVLGLAGAAAATRLLQTLLTNVNAFDPLVYAGVAVGFAGLAALACLVPSLRAARVDPLTALGDDRAPARQA